MNTPVKLLDVVALMEDIKEKNLFRGQVGTVVEILDTHVFEVEFCYPDGKTYVLLPIETEKLMVLHYTPLEHLP